VYLRSQSRPGESSGWVSTRAQSYQSTHLNPCSWLSPKSSYRDVTWDRESHLKLWQGKLSLWLYCAQTTLFCSLPFFLSLSVVLRAVLTAAGPSAPSVLAGRSCAWGCGPASRWWSVTVSTTSIRDLDTFTACNPALCQLMCREKARHRAQFFI